MTVLMRQPVKRILMLYPEFPKTYWGMNYSLPMIGKKASMPPLGLITIAALTPPHYEIRLIDLDFQTITEEDLEWADMFCFSAMLIQKKSLFKAAAQCRGRGKLVVFGGPYPTSSPEECEPHCDVLVLDEGEMTWPMFLKDLEEGHPKKIYRSGEKPDVTQTPVPRFDLLNVLDYWTMPIQFSRGCPFMCEFCDITVLFGRRPRTKTPEQMIRELEALYATGYRGSVFIVDDNFIGNKKDVKNLLPKLKEWNESKGCPFYYGTEASINLADDEELLKGMVESLFMWVFVGLESPSEESLKETKKLQNTGNSLSLVDRVKVLQNAGFIVWGGFIVGFDSDKADIFDRQIEFIQQAAIPNAAVAVLYALPGTPLHTRMKRENRLQFEESRTETEGADTSGHFSELEYTNILTNIPRKELIEGYFRIVKHIYSPVNYFNRAYQALSRQPGPPSITAGIKKLFRMSRILSSNFSMKSKLAKDVRQPSTFSKTVHLYRECSKLPQEFKKEMRAFIWRVLRKCPFQAMWIMPYILMGVHYYRFTVEDVLPKRLPYGSPELEVADEEVPAAIPNFVNV